MPKKRRIKSADIRFVSLCPRGMNGLRTLYKSDGDGKGGTVTIEPLLKECEGFLEKGQLVAAVWVPDRADKEGDWADRETIEKMAHSFARNGLKIDLKHDERTLTVDQAYVAESFVIQKGDPRFSDLKDYDGTPVNAEGGWGAVFQIDDPQLRKEYREGKWGGVSMAGPALVVDEDPPRPMVEKMRSLLDKDQIDMTAEELQKALEASNATLLAGITELMKGGSGTEEKPKDVPALDLTNEAEVKKHLRALELSQIDINDPEALRKHLQTFGGERSDEVTEAKAELAKAQARLQKLEGKSNQPADGAEGTDEEAAALKKRDEAVKQMIKFANEPFAE